MRNLLKITFLFAASLALILGGAGCTKEAKKARRLSKADGYFQAGEYEKAEIEYKNVFQIEPMNPEAVSRLGIIFFEQGRSGIAAAFLIKARELQPDNLDARLKLAMVYAGTNRLADAREQAIYVLEHRPNDEDAPVFLAETATQAKEAEEIRQRLQKLPNIQTAPVQLALGLLDLRQGKIADAEAAFNRAKTMAPNSSAVNFSLGTLYIAQKKLPEAGKALETAASLSPIRSPRRIRYAQFNIQTGKPEIARQIVTEITQKAPDSVTAWMLLANMRMTEKKYDDSMAALAKLLALDPLNHDALLLRARVLFDKGDREHAIAELERQSKVFPKSPELLFQLGRAHLAMGNGEKAAASLAQGLTLAPGFPGPTMMLADVNIRLGKAETAINALKPFIQKNPAIAEARLLLAQAYRVQGKLDEALEVYRQIEKAFAPRPEPAHLSGLILLQQKKWEEARAAFTKALAIDPTFIAATEQLVDADLAQKKYVEAKQRVDTMLVKRPESAELYILLAKIHLAESDTKQAEAALQRVVALQPDSPTGFLMLSRLYIVSKEKDKALANLQQAVAKNPKNVEALMLIAVINEQQNNFAVARDSYEKVVAISPKFAVALNNLAFLYSERFGELEKAFQLAQRAREALPLDPNIADTLGWIVFKKGQYARAVSLLSEAAEKLTKSAEAQFHVGMAQYQMGAEKPAKAAFERALALNATFVGANEARQALAVLGIDPVSGGSAAQASLEKVVAANPNDSIALTRLGAVYTKSGNVDKAKATLEAALKANPGNIAAAMDMVRIHLAQKDTAKAMELAKATRKLAPDDPEVAHAVGKIAFGAGDYTWSLSLLQESARKQTDDPEIFYDLARAAYAKGQITIADTALRDALKLSDTFPQAAKARGLLEMLDLAADPSRATAALSMIDQKLKSDPIDVPALMVLATAQESNRGTVEAVKAYEKILTVYPQFSPALRRLTIIEAAKGGNDAKALERGTAARETFANDPELSKALGMITYRQGNYARAKSFLEESFRQLSSDAEVAYYLGMAQHNLKERASSVRSLQKAQELGLKSDLALEAKKVIGSGK